MTGPTIGELFAGYGGASLALESIWPDATTAWVSDIDPGPRKVLAHHYPDAPNLGDVTEIDWANVEPVDIITGGSPCQDLSHAGKRQGMRPGTRSGLWASMHDAITILRPSLVVWENVRGALSAHATTGEVESCGFCVANGEREPMRALGRVLGDLADIGYDAAWVGLRAADVGACHGRFRVFVLAWPADAERERSHEWRVAEPREAASGWTSADHRGRGGAPVVLPTPRATRGWSSTETLAMLPTPAVNDMGKAYTPDEWDEWTAAQKAKHGNGNGHGKSLEIEAARLLPTVKASNNENRQTRSDTFRAGPNLGEAIREIGNEGPGEEAAGQDVSSVRQNVQSEVVREASRGCDALPEQSDLLTGMRECEGRDSGRLVPPSRSEADAADYLRGLRDARAASCASPRQERGEQLAGEPRGAVRVVPHSPALAGGPRGAIGGDACGCGAYGIYAQAVHRWEGVLGRPAPSPTEPTGREGKARLSVHLTEFMMGLPAGWITDVPDVSRNEALKLCGNGIVPQQMAEAVRYLLAVRATSEERAA